MQFLRVQIVTTVGQGRSGFVLLLPPPTPLSLSLVLAIRLKASGQTFISPVLSLNIFSTAEEEMRLPNRKKNKKRGQVFINSNDDKACQWLSPVPVSISAVFSWACSGEETKTTAREKESSSHITQGLWTKSIMSQLTGMIM